MAFLSGILSWIIKDILGWLLEKISGAITFSIKWSREKAADDKKIDDAVKEDLDAKTKEERDKAADDLTHTGF